MSQQLPCGLGRASHLQRAAPRHSVPSSHFCPAEPSPPTYSVPRMCGWLPHAHVLGRWSPYPLPCTGSAAMPAPLPLPPPILHAAYVTLLPHSAWGALLVPPSMAQITDDLAAFTATAYKVTAQAAGELPPSRITQCCTALPPRIECAPPPRALTGTGVRTVKYKHLRVG